MQSTDKLLSLMREGNLELHCINVRIWQDGGIELFGHGAIRINKHGVLYLEFICTKNSNMPKLFLPEEFPKDALNDKERFYLECETLTGDVLKASKFSVKLDLVNIKTPSHINIFLSNVQCDEIKDEDDDFLFFEFSERCDVPANRSNSEISTLGYESHSWNQAVIEMDGFTVSIIDKKKYTYVRVTGTFDVQRVFECLRFYIGFTCGSMIQPIFTIQRSRQHQVSTISSISSLQKHQRSSNPVPSTYDQKGFETEYHYQIFKGIYRIYEVRPDFFESIYTQWARVWYSFQSKNSITILTLSIAIEGLLNDIFIPKFKQLSVNDHLDEKISRIRCLISNLDISEADINRLKSTVSYWKNISAAKALGYLVVLGIVSQEEKKSWDKLRNSSAHPKTKEMNTASLESERNNLLICLNLFHNLIFNTLQYSGPRHYWEVSCDNPLKIFEHIEIDKSSKQLLESRT